MKAYQHHDAIADKGKALPHEKQPTTKSSRPTWYRVSLDEDNYRQDFCGTITRTDGLRQRKRLARRARSTKQQQFAS